MGAIGASWVKNKQISTVYFMSPIEKSLSFGSVSYPGKQRDVLPAVEVKNKVLWVNSSFVGRLPFNITVGRQTNLGLFLTPDCAPKEYSIEIDKWQEFELSRAGIVSRVFFRDSNGVLYRDVLAKGIGLIKLGYLSGGARPYSVSEPIKNEYTRGVWGICNRLKAEEDRNWSERFYKLGMRVARPIAIIEIEEIIGRNGQKFTIEEARSEGMIRAEQSPVIYLRAFGVETRLSSFINMNEENRLACLNDARVFAAQELGVDEKSFNYDDYLSGLSLQIGMNLNILDASGHSHYNLESLHNISLDGRFMDFDSIGKMVRVEHRMEGYRTEFEQLRRRLGGFFRSVVAIKGIKLSMDLESFRDSFKGFFNLQYIREHVRSFGPDFFKDITSN